MNWICDDYRFTHTRFRLSVMGANRNDARLDYRRSDIARSRQELSQGQVSRDEECCGVSGK